MFMFYQSRYLLIVFILAILNFFQLGCANKSPVERVQYVMGTRANVYLPDGDHKSAGESLEIINRLDALLSDYRENSEISQINRYAGIKPVKVDPLVVEVLERSVEVAERTDGAFDPTIGALTIDVYRFGRENERVPSEEEIQKALSLVNYREMEITEGTVYLEKKGMKIDLGGIGKGFAVDKAVELLKDRGIKKAVVSISGDMRMYGFKNSVGIQHPDGKGVIASFNTGYSDIAISTSGDYRRFIKKDGRIFHHLIEPSEGSPRRDFSSVTVLTYMDSAKADAYSTAFFVMGREKSLDMVKGMNDTGVFFIYSNGEIFINEFFKQAVRNLKINDSVKYNK